MPAPSQRPTIDDFLRTLQVERRADPKQWHQFWKFLSAKRMAGRPAPPVPLILAASGESPASKHARLASQLRWAEENNCAEEALHYLLSFPRGDWHVSSEAGWHSESYPYSPNCDYIPKPKPTPEAVANAQECLRSRWLEIAGPDVGHITEPVEFTGAKSRRLLVRAVVGTKPPWGSWTEFSPDASRASFTRLRASLNRAIAPLEVDHIDFLEELTTPPSRAPKEHRP